jgi:hypothetical protein
MPANLLKAAEGMEAAIQSVYLTIADWAERDHEPTRYEVSQLAMTLLKAEKAALAQFGQPSPAQRKAQHARVTAILTGKGTVGNLADLALGIRAPNPGELEYLECERKPVERKARTEREARAKAKLSELRAERRQRREQLRAAKRTQLGDDDAR